ncbi:PREDICTED: pollen-specific leucine-rich repeat extensin-like protein 1 [Camelina sativa]|uniref:Pollen-specific leucine-rich repeat extensin-like protein 1 n=1 Tax=Camelina sativa TaxID=90675 RepID=A0ABM0Y589_CAMSA|nr:PREDICTED: pollen-specific leucine-rich repeat extensin-like protein 1 [Camelina sativa]
MVLSIGEALGEILDWEISSSSILLQLLLNGMEPLTKETIIEFSDGSEAVVCLEYKNLKNHCSYCQRLTHDKSVCPGLPDQRKDQNLHSRAAAPSSTQQTSSRNYYTPQDNFLPPQRQTRSFENHSSQRPNQQSRKRPYAAISLNTRNVPDFRQTARNTRDRQDRLVRQSSIARSTHSREEVTPQQYGHNSPPAPPTRNLQWREKTRSSTEIHGEPSVSSRARRPPLEREVASPDPPTPPPENAHIQTIQHQASHLKHQEPETQTREQIMNELQEITIQYMSCPDPVESAARRMRVLQTDSVNLMEETANSILASNQKTKNHLPLPPPDQPANKPLNVKDTTSSAILQKNTSETSKRGRGRPPLQKQTGKTNQPLRGAKPQKRILTQGSPRKSPNRTSSSKSGFSKSTQKKVTKQDAGNPRVSDHSAGEPSGTLPANSNPPRISLIPASKKKKADFQNPPTPLP